MTFVDIKHTLKDLFHGKAETWRDLSTDDIHFESILHSSVGNNLKT